MCRLEVSGNEYDYPSFDLRLYDDGWYEFLPLPSFGSSAFRSSAGRINVDIVRGILNDASNLGFFEVPESLLAHGDAPFSMRLSIGGENARRTIVYNPPRLRQFADAAIREGDRYARELYTVYLLGERLLAVAQAAERR